MRRFRALVPGAILVGIVWGCAGRETMTAAPRTAISNAERASTFDAGPKALRTTPPASDPASLYARFERGLTECYERGARDIPTMTSGKSVQTTAMP